MAFSILAARSSERWASKRVIRRDASRPPASRWPLLIACRCSSYCFCADSARSSISWRALAGSYAAAFMSDTPCPFAALVIFVPFLHDRQHDPRLQTQPLGTSDHNATRYALATSSFLCGDGHTCLHDTHCLRMHPHRHGTISWTQNMSLYFGIESRMSSIRFWSSRFLLW